MITVLLSSKNDFKSKLSKILDSAKQMDEVAIAILVNRPWYIDIYEFMSNHKNVGKIKIAGQTFFAIKEMRVEIKPIDLYI